MQIYKCQNHTFTYNSGIIYYKKSFEFSTKMFCFETYKRNFLRRSETAQLHCFILNLLRENSWRVCENVSMCRLL